MESLVDSAGSWRSGVVLMVGGFDFVNVCFYIKKVHRELEGTSGVKNNFFQLIMTSRSSKLCVPSRKPLCCSTTGGNFFFFFVISLPLYFPYNMLQNIQDVNKMPSVCFINFHMASCIEKI